MENKFLVYNILIYKLIYFIHSVRINQRESAEINQDSRYINYEKKNNNKNNFNFVNGRLGNFGL